MSLLHELYILRLPHPTYSEIKGHDWNIIMKAEPVTLFWMIY